MNDRSTLSLEELVNEAVARKTTGDTHAKLDHDARTMSPHKRAALEEMAATEGAQGGKYSEMLEWLQEAREATFVDPFARVAYFRLETSRVTAEETPDPDKVLGLFYSARSTKMWIRGMEDPQPAIPLCKEVDASEAKRYRQYLIVPNAYRFQRGGEKRIGTRRVLYVVPSTANDHEAFNQLRAVWKRMPEALVKHFEATDNHDVRDAVWLALHFMPQARVLPQHAVERTFIQKDSKFIQKGSERVFVGYTLTPMEILLIEQSELADRLMARLALFSSVIARTIKK